MSPSARSLAFLRSQGWTGDVVERWIGGGGFKVRKDFCGYADLVALKPDGHGHPIAIAVQATSGTNVTHRLSKMRGIPAAIEWLDAGGRIEIHGWAKRGKRGERKTWQVRLLVVTRESLG